MDPQEIIDLVEEECRKIEERLAWLRAEVTRRVNEIMQKVP